MLQHQGLFRPKSTNATKLSSVEKKLLVVSVYYTVFAAVFLAYFSVSTTDQDKFLDAAIVYFRCEALGHNPNHPCPKNYEQYVHPYLQTVAYILMSLVPAASLVLLLRVRRKQDITSHFSGKTASQTECYCERNWQWQVGVVAVFLAWINLVIFAEKIPLTGLYVVMFLNIFYTFMRMVILAFLLVISFALAFYMLFYDPDDVSYLKVCVNVRIMLYLLKVWLLWIRTM